MTWNSKHSKPEPNGILVALFILATSPGMGLTQTCSRSPRGFKVEYEKLDDKLWFPAEYGGEFKLKALFFYKRSMAIALHNHGFQRSTVSTVLTYSDPFSTASEVSAHDPH